MFPCNPTPPQELPASLPDVRVVKSELERLPPAFPNPQLDTFQRAVEVMVTHRVGKYRQKEHPNYIAFEADAVRLVDRITSKIVEKEREHFAEKREPVLKDKLQEKITGCGMRMRCSVCIGGGGVDVLLLSQASRSVRYLTDAALSRCCGSRRRFVRESVQAFVTTQRP